MDTASIIADTAVVVSTAMVADTAAGIVIASIVVNTEGPIVAIAIAVTCTELQDCISLPSFLCQIHQSYYHFYVSYGS